MTFDTINNAAADLVTFWHMFIPYMFQLDKDEHKLQAGSHC